MKVPLGSERFARIAHGAIAADPEPHPEMLYRHLWFEDNVLHLYAMPLAAMLCADPWFVSREFAAQNAKMLRTAMSGILELLALSIETMSRFDHP